MKRITSLLLIAPLLWAVTTSAQQAPANAPITQEAKPAEDGKLTLNFRDVPLQSVLDYLSKAAGFIIVMEAEVQGNITAWSHSPITKDEAVELLNTILFTKGFAAIRNDRTLLIVPRDDAKRKNIPVKRGADPEMIPASDEMVTQIIPIRYISAGQLVATLDPLLPEHATLSADESSNALVMTDSQNNIRRMTEIIAALDGSVSDITSIKVYPLRNATATEAVEIVNSLVGSGESTGGRGGDSRGGGDGRSDARSIFERLRGGGGGGSPFGRGGR